MDLTEQDPVHELKLKDNMKVIKKMKLELSPQTELDEAVFLGSRYCNIEKRLNLNKILDKGVQSHNDKTKQFYRSCSEEKEKFLEKIMLLEVKKMKFQKQNNIKKNFKYI